MMMMMMMIIIVDDDDDDEEITTDDACLMMKSVTLDSTRPPIDAAPRYYICLAVSKGIGAPLSLGSSCEAFQLVLVFLLISLLR